MPAKRPVRSAFLVTFSALALAGCQSEGGAPHTTNPPATNPPTDPPAPTLTPTTATSDAPPPAQITDPKSGSSPTPSVYHNPPPPVSELSWPMNAKVAGRYVVSDGAKCTTEGDHGATACPDFMKDPAWKKCSGGLFYMSGDSARCYCKHPSAPDDSDTMACPAAKPSPWPPKNG